jgi:hypothetical protein
MRRGLLALVALSAVSLAACGTPPLPPPSASLDNIQAVRRGQFAPMAVGAFVPGPGAPTSMDRRIAIRAESQAAPKSSGGSYARFLGDTLAAELAGAGKLDAKAPLEVSGVITDAHVDSAMPMAEARMTARITLKRDGRAVFEKDFTSRAEWKSSLMGAVAIPDAFNHYLGLFPDLVKQLFADRDFQAAVRG